MFFIGTDNSCQMPVSNLNSVGVVFSKKEIGGVQVRARTKSKISPNRLEPEVTFLISSYKPLASARQPVYSLTYQFDSFPLLFVCLQPTDLLLVYNLASTLKKKFKIIYTCVFKCTLFVLIYIRIFPLEHIFKIENQKFNIFEDRFSSIEEHIYL